MANAYSIARQYNQPQDTMDLGFVNQVLATKQGQYDANMAKVDALIESTINMPLAREADKKILYQNILNLENEINTFSKMQLTSTDTLRSINNSIQSAITPYIAEQLANSQKIINFQTEMSKKRDKSPELWNDDNYQYALDNAGYTNYLRGVDENGKKVDSLGELRYYDNVDLTKNLTEPLEKYIKEAGLDKYSTVQTSDYVNKIMSGERVTNEKINNFINNKISSDPKLAKQLEINAYSSYRGMDDQEFMQNWKASNSTQRDFYKKAITEIDENLKQADPNSEDFKNLSAQKEFAESKIKDIQDIVDGKSTKSRRQIEFEVYTNGLKSNYANTYAFDRIEKIDYDTTPLKILEFQTNTQFKQAELELKRNELDGLNSQGGVAGTPVDIASGTAEINKTTPERVQDTWVNARDSFANIMAQTDPEFSSLSEQAKVDKLVAVANSLTNLSIDQSPYSAELTQAALSFLTANNTNIEYRKEVNTRWKPVVKTAYQKILEGRGGDLNISNLATTMPNVAGFVRQGVKYDNLTVPQKHLVLAELSNNMAKYVATNREDKRELETFNFNFRKDLKGKELEAYNKASNRSTITAGSALGYSWEGIKEGASFVANSVLSQIAPTISTIAQGEGAGLKTKIEIEKNAQNNLSNLTRAIGLYGASISSPFQSDRNVGELQERDLGGDTGFKDWFNQESSRIGTSRTQKDAKFLPTQQETKGMSWNPQDKNQKQITETFDNLVIAQGKKVAKESTYRAYRDGNDVVLEFLGETTQMGGKSGDTVKRTVGNDQVRIPVNQVPSNILNSLGTSEQWNLGSTNMNVPKMNMNYNLPKDKDERTTRLNNFFLNGLGQNLDSQTRDGIKSGGFMATAEDLILDYRRDITTPEQVQQTNLVMNSKFGSIVKPDYGSGFKAILTIDGKPTRFESTTLPSFNTLDMVMWTDRLVKMYVKEKMDQITKR